MSARLRATPWFGERKPYGVAEQFREQWKEQQRAAAFFGAVTAIPPAPAIVLYVAGSWPVC